MIKIRRMARRLSRRLSLRVATLVAEFSPTLGLRVAGYRRAPAGGAESQALTTARETAVEAFKAFDTFCKERGIEDANDLDGDKFPDDVKARFKELEAAGWEADRAFVALEKRETNGQRVTSARDRLSHYTETISGRPMHYTEIRRPKSLGQSFIESESYQALLKSGALRSDHVKFMTDPVAEEKAATDIIGTTTGDPAAGLVTPMLLPGVLPLPQRPLTVRELFSQASMTMGDSIEYAAQVAFDAAAAAVVQAAADGNPTGAKPQSSIAWERRTAPATTIATWMAVTRQTLQDASQVESLINNQGRLMIQLEEEEELLSGDGSAPNLAGLQSIATVQTLDLTGEDNLDGIRHAKTMVRTGLSRLSADAIVLHPNDSEAFDLLKDGENRYRGGDPFGQFPDANPIWRLRRVESEGVDEGTAIVGAFRAGATVFDRQPLTVYTSDSHSDFFIRNLVAILFEERIAFPVFFPSAFVIVTLSSTGFGEASGEEGIVSA